MHAEYLSTIIALTYIYMENQALPRNLSLSYRFNHFPKFLKSLLFSWFLLASEINCLLRFFVVLVPPLINSIRRHREKYVFYPGSVFIGICSFRKTFVYTSTLSEKCLYHFPEKTVLRYASRTDCCFSSNNILL